jgi:hypothetical protein
MRKTQSTLAIVAAFFLVVFLTGETALAAGFAPPVVYAAGMGPNYVTGQDLNYDGNLDLVVTNLLSNNVSILLGNGDGTFQAAVNYPVGSSPTSVAIGCTTVVGGTAVLAVTNSSSNNVSLLVGNGDGTFQPAVNYGLGTGTNPRNVTWADYNGDGNCDLAVANSSGGTNNEGNVAILFGNGDGTYQSAVNYDTLGSEPVSLTTSDFDGNGTPDVALANFASNSVTILLNNGSGVFSPGGDYPAGTGPTSISDLFIVSSFYLVVTNSSSNSISLLYSTGDGTFNHLKSFPSGQYPVSAAIGIFNESNYLFDLAVVNQNDNTVSVYTGKTFSASIAKASYVRNVHISAVDLGGNPDDWRQS